MELDYGVPMQSYKKKRYSFTFFQCMGSFGVVSDSDVVRRNCGDQAMLQSTKVRLSV